MIVLSCSRLSRFLSQPNLMIIPPQLALYMTLAPDEKVTYKDGGPAAVANFEAGVEGFTTRAFRGCGIVTSEPFEVSDGTHSTTELDRSAVTPILLTRCHCVLYVVADMEAVQMLQRFTQVGEFYVMTNPDGLKKSATGFMDILIYDEESDRHVKISYRSALIATGLFDNTMTLNVTVANDGIAATTPLGPAAAGYGTIDEWAKVALLLLKANEEGVTADNLDKSKPDDYIVGKDAPVVLARPFIEHAMLSAVLAVSGGDTGATIFGPSDMQISVRLNPTPTQDPAGILSYLLLFVSCHFAGQHLGQNHRRVSLPFEPIITQTHTQFGYLTYFRSLCVLTATTRAISRRSSQSIRTCSCSRTSWPTAIVQAATPNSSRVIRWVA